MDAAQRQIGDATLAAFDVAERVGRIVLEMVGDAAAHFAAGTDEGERDHEIYDLRITIYERLG